MPNVALQAIEYSLGSDATDEAVIGALSKRGTATYGSALHLDRTFLDTFDGRLLKHGSLLEIAGEGDAMRLVWRSCADGTVLGESAATSARFVWELEPGPLRSQLEPVVEMRALLPLVRVRSELRPLALRNRDGKLVVRATVARHEAYPPDEGPGCILPPILRLEPVRGYEKELMDAAGRIEKTLAARPAPPSLLRAALDAVGISPPVYSNKVRVALQPDEPAESALRRILLHLLDAMEANAEGTRQGLDSEFLHDFRVAVRRTRSALSQVKGVLPTATVERFGDEFAWLGTVTGPARDLDVYVLSFPAYRSLLPAPLRSDLDPLEELLLRRQKKEQKRVAQALSSRRYTALAESWRAVLVQGEPIEDTHPVNAQRPVSEVAAKRIRRVFDRTLREGAAIDDDSHPEQFHELRKTCKKLRYLLEFFLSLYPRDEMDSLISALKSLQDNLGEYQDLSVQIESLNSFEEELGVAGVASPTTLRAIDVLIDAFEHRQAEVRSEFAQRFEAFSGPDTVALLQEALRSSRRSRKGTIS